MSWHEPWAAEIKLAPKSVWERHSLSLLQAERTEAPAFYRGLLIDKYDQSGRSLRAFGAMALRKFCEISDCMMMCSLRSSVTAKMLAQSEDG